MTARRIMWPLTILLTAAVIALVVPGSPFYLTDLLASGWDYKWRSTAYWIRELDSEDEEARYEAIYALGSIQPPAEEAVPFLAKLMTDSPDRNMRNQAALSLSKMAPASRLAVPALAKALSDDESWVRMNAAFALSRLGAEARPAAAELVQALRDQSNHTNLGRFAVTIQQLAAMSLGRCSNGYPESVQALTQALDKDTWDGLRLYAVVALGEIGPEARSAVPQIRALLQQSNEQLRDAAAAALKLIEAEPL